MRIRTKLRRLILLLCWTCSAKVQTRFVKASTRWIDTFFLRFINIFSKQSRAIGTSSFEGPALKRKYINGLKEKKLIKKKPTSSKMEKDFVQVCIKVKRVDVESFSLAREHSKDYLNCIQTLTVIKLIICNKVVKYFN